MTGNKPKRKGGRPKGMKGLNGRPATVKVDDDGRDMTHVIKRTGHGTYEDEPRLEEHPDPRHPGPNGLLELKYQPESNFDASNLPESAAYFAHPPPEDRSAFFKEKWATLVEVLASRPSFTIGLLVQLEVLCDLYEEYAALTMYINRHGTQYTCWSRYGKTIKLYEQVKQRSVVRNEISRFCKQLGFEIKRHDSVGAQKNTTDWE